MVVLIILLILAIAYASFATFFALRWAKIIMLLEDDLTEAIEIHERSIDTFDTILKMPMFFDSPEVKAAATEVLADIKVCKLATLKVITTFTQRSKQRYVRIENEE